MKTGLKAAVAAIALATAALFTTSCGTPFPLGCIYTDFMEPVALGDGHIQYNRAGYAYTWSVLGWFAGGNSSINLAANQGEMKMVSWASRHVQNYLGIYGRFTTVVYGIGAKADPTVAPLADYQ